MESNVRSTIKECDWLMVISVVLFTLMRVFTVMTFHVIATETGAQIDAIHTAYEASPVFKAFLNLGQINYVIQFLLIPALLLTVYVILRKRVIGKKFPAQTLQFHSFFLFFFLMFNFLNDAASLAGRLL